MAKKCVINVDLADLFKKPDKKLKNNYLHSLAWGDYVDVLKITDEYVKVKTVKYEEKSDGSILPVEIDAYICPSKSSKIKPSEIVVPAEKNQVLKVNFVDVQQGDGTIIESPDGKVILVDGGKNQMFARYLAARFRGTSLKAPKKIDCIVVTHGDGDHVLGLAEIVESEVNPEQRKKLFILPERVYHNGMIRYAVEDKTPDVEYFGSTRVSGDETILTELVDDPLSIPSSKLHDDFKELNRAFSTWNSRKKIKFRRLKYGDDRAFDFFNTTDLKISVLGPEPFNKGNVSGLKFFGEPRADGSFGTPSASHTINGNSIVLKLAYGGFSYLLTGDVNAQAGLTLLEKRKKGQLNLQSEVYKVPHHGSADFSLDFMKAVSPIVSVVSSGDESAAVEFIHPRATLLGALGRCSRIDNPLIFVTELVAFFTREGKSELADTKGRTKRGIFYGFSRAAYGIVKTRTDGKRLLVYTDSGKARLKESYCFKLGDGGMPVPDKVVRV